MENFNNNMGKKMQVSNDGIKWYKRIVFNKNVNGIFMALSLGRKTMFNTWNRCRYIETNIEI